MKLYVGTLHCGEREYDDCVAALRRQSHRDFDHFVFRDLGNRASHDALFNDFLARKDSYPVMVKLDADMVLTRPDVLAGIARRFTAEPALDVLTIAVHDWFSDAPLMGLNAYRNTIGWHAVPEDLFVDGVPLRYRTRAADWDALAPAAWHAANPSPLQAFHYGLHRGLKAIQPGRPDARREHWRLREQWRNLRRTEAHFHRTRDPRLGLAVLGAELAFAGVFRPEHAAYTDAYAREVLSRFVDADARTLGRAIRRTRARAWGWLPDRPRRALLWYRHRERRLRVHALLALLKDLWRERSAPGAPEVGA